MEDQASGDSGAECWDFKSVNIDYRSSIVQVRTVSVVPPLTAFLCAGSIRLRKSAFESFNIRELVGDIGFPRERKREKG